MVIYFWKIINNWLEFFGVNGYPTVWLVKPQILESSKINFLKLGKLGYVAGGPEKWISVAQKFLNQN